VFLDPVLGAGLLAAYFLKGKLSSLFVELLEAV